MRDGGNQWSGWPSYLSFFRHVAKLEIDYSKWDHYEQAALHSGPRWMHPEFCIVSDRPEVLLVDEENRPHCETGPFCKWRDGSRLYAIHGVYVPENAITAPGTLTAEQLEGMEDSALAICLPRAREAEQGLLRIWKSKEES
jgi:hypothetical protein